MTQPETELPISPSLRTWFEAALKQPLAERTRWLEENCADVTLRDAVRQLLHAHSSDDDPWQHPLGEWFLALDDEAAAG
jgi:hypothetical protein